MTFVHGSNLRQKEDHKTKYLDEESRQFLREIRAQYDEWHAANQHLVGPRLARTDSDQELVASRVRLFGAYKEFLDQQKYAEKFDSRSNLHSTVLEEFLFYLFKDLVADFGANALLGKSHTFKDVFFVPPNYRSMLGRPFAKIETKDHDFVIGSSVAVELVAATPPPEEAAVEAPAVREAPADPYSPTIEGSAEQHRFDLPAVAVECKTYLDKTMLEGSSRAADELKARVPNALYIVVMEWLKLTEAVNLRKYKVDQIYVLRRQRNTDREFRYGDDYVKNPIDPAVVWHMFSLVREHLSADWEGGIAHGLERGWLI
jgi:hypothetical protein